MQCPVCRASNDQGPHCRRCRADLSLLFALEERRRQLLGAAQTELARGNPARALDLAAKVDELQRDAVSQRLLAICHLLHQNFAEAWRVYQSTLRTR